MRTDKSKTVQFGDLVVAAFDEAANHASDPEEVSRLATMVVMQVFQSQRAFWPGLPRARAHGLWDQTS
jgi:hypothetical protein